MATAPMMVEEQLPTGPTESEIQEKLGSIVDRLDKLAKDQVTRKGHVETRWLENLRAFHGRYDEKTEANLADSTKSRAYVKITRKKSNSWEARLSALLFPTDEENWDITPTPVPSLHEHSQRSARTSRANGRTGKSSAYRSWGASCSSRGAGCARCCGKSPTGIRRGAEARGGHAP